ncbi:hypothetical protein [Butyrivibrio sp. AE3004]|uniref:hypothetical protein n=1 Tax=Butyrivibrio sp. AE3004 TaxID=1506994 RepID=UPI0004941E82|nr:hypothetical protein [Butyrivibrio sp. AE3004]
MNTLLGKKIADIPYEIQTLQKSVQDILTGISKWTKDEDYVQLRLLIPRLIQLLSRIDKLEEEVDGYMEAVKTDSDANLTVVTLEQQKLLIVQEKQIIQKLLDDVSLSTKVIESSEKEVLAGEILERCRELEISMRKMK